MLNAMSTQPRPFERRQAATLAARLRAALTGVVPRARKADWRSPAEIKRVYANASIVGENRVVVNTKGNKYRLVVAMSPCRPPAIVCVRR